MIQHRKWKKIRMMRKMKTVKIAGVTTPLSRKKEAGTQRAAGAVMANMLVFLMRKEVALDRGNGTNIPRMCSKSWSRTPPRTWIHNEDHSSHFPGNKALGALPIHLSL